MAVLCRLCHERTVPPSHLERSDHRCSRCRNSTPAAKARSARYLQSDTYRRTNQRVNACRVWVGHEYHSHAETEADARAIGAHVKARRRAFFARGLCAAQ